MIYRQPACTYPPACHLRARIGIATWAFDDEIKSEPVKRYLRVTLRTCPTCCACGIPTHSKLPAVPPPWYKSPSIQRVHQPNPLRERTALSSSNPRNPDFGGPARVRFSDTLKSIGISKVVVFVPFDPARARAECPAQLRLRQRHPHDILY